MPDVMTMIQRGLPPKTTITFHQVLEAQFRDPEFYDGSIATVVGPNGTVLLERSGESRLESPEDNVRTAAQFRELFPDGILPHDDAPFAAHVSTDVDADASVWTWVNNGWFSLYHGDNPDDDITHDVFEAVNDAITLASRAPAGAAPASDAATPGVPAQPTVPVPAATMVTLWTCAVDDRENEETSSSVHYTDAQVTASLRENYADGEDVSDEDLEEFLMGQGIYYQVSAAQMDTALMSNQS